MEIADLYAFRYRLVCERVLGKMVANVESEPSANDQEAAGFFDWGYKQLKTELLNCAVTILTEAREKALSVDELRRDFAVTMLHTLDLFRSKHRYHEIVSSDPEVKVSYTIE